MTASRQTVSACLIVCDERERLPACLASIAFCDEVIVVDAGSRDGTDELARHAGAKVISHPWRGFAAQRNVALARARSDWVLEIDADERVTPALRVEIERFLGDPPDDVEMVALPRRETLVGRRLGPGCKYPNYQHRLFRRGAYWHDESRTVHEGMEPHGPVRALDGDLEHLLAGTWREAVADAWRYSALEAEQTQPPGSAFACLGHLAVRPPAKLLYRLTVAGGWRDGWTGAAKVVIECGSDVLVWIRVMATRGISPAASDGRRIEPHFGRPERRRAGAARIVALAQGPRASARTARWLEQARATGADVALITDAPPITNGVPLRRLSRMSPWAVAGALEIESQLRQIDALALDGARARLLTRWLPRPLRGYARAIDPRACDGAEAARRVQAEARAQRPLPSARSSSTSERACAPLRNRPVVCVGFADWDAELPTNQHHLMSRLARYNQVLFVESLGLRRPQLAGRDLRRMARRVARGLRPVRRADGVDILAPLVIPLHSRPWVRALNARLLRHQVRRAARRLGFRAPILWSYVPQAEPLIEALEPEQVIYHCVDDIAEQKGIHAESFRQAEARFAARADLVIATSPALAARMATVNRRVLHAPNVADTAIFNQVLEPGPVDAALAALAPPRIVFVGAVVATKLDIPLIVALARLRPRWSFALIGPVGAGDPRGDVSALRREPNIFLLGSRAHAALPSVLRGADAALIPYAVNRLTASVFPMKVYEYLAAGLPVVSTALPALQGVGGIAIASDADAMAARLDELLAADHAAARRERARLAETHSWEARIAELEQALVRT